MWESTWMDAERTERRLWKQTIQAFAVDRWGMCPAHGGPFTSPVQHDSLASMLAAHPGRKTFLIPPGRILRTAGLAEYEHPADAIYVFGRAGETLVQHVTDGDDVVTIFTPGSAVMFGHVALAAVLYDRLVKRVD
jgi:hypothetical protein